MEALKLYEEGRFRDAEFAYRNILKTNPTHAESMHMLGVSIAQIGRHDEAIELLRKSTEYAPDNSQFQNNLGEALRQSNQIDSAIIAFRNAIDIDEDNFEAHLNLSGIMVTRGELTKALRLARSASELRPMNATAQVSLGELLQLTDDQEGALLAAERAIEIDPNYDKGLNLKGFLLHEKGEHKKSIPYFEAGLQANPLSASCHRNLAAALEAMNRFEDAAQIYQEQLRLANSDPYPFIGLGRTNRFQKKYLAAERWLLDGLETFPNFCLLHCELGLTLIGLQRQKDAETHLIAAVSGLEPLPRANIEFGKFLLNEGRLAEAATQFKIALNHLPNDPDAASGLAQALVKTN